MATGNTNYGTDGLLATTMDKYVPRLEDQIFTSTPLLWILKQRGIQTEHGNKIVQPLLYAELSSHGSFSDDDVFASPSAAGITAAEYDFKQYYASVRFTGIELAKNSGKEQVLSLLKSRMKQAEMTISEALNSQFFGDGTGNSGKDFTGLKAIVDDNNTYGNIDRTDANNSWWHADLTALGGALTLAAMRTKYNNVSEGRDQPTNILTTQTVFEDYEGLLQDNVRYEDTAMGDAGFQTLMYKAAPIAFDRDCDTGYMYFLNTEYLQLHSLNGRWFDITDWLVPVNQDVKYKNILVYGELTASNAKRQGVITGIA